MRTGSKPRQKMRLRSDTSGSAARSSGLGFGAMGGRDGQRGDGMAVWLLSPTVAEAMLLAPRTYHHSQQLDHLSPQ